MRPTSASRASSLTRMDGWSRRFDLRTESADLRSSSSSRSLHLQAARVAAEAAVAAQDPVAGDDERDRVARAGRAGGADGALVAGAAGEVGVGAGLAVGDRGDPLAGAEEEAVAELPVDRQLEGRGGGRRSSRRARAAPRRGGRGPRGPAARSARPGRPASPRRPRPAGRGGPGRAASSPAAGCRRASRRSRRRRRAGPRRRRARAAPPVISSPWSWSCHLLSQSFQSLVQAAAGRRR